MKGPTAYLLETPPQLVDPKQGGPRGPNAGIEETQQQPNELDDSDYNNFVLIGTPKHHHHPSQQLPTAILSDDNNNNNNYQGNSIDPDQQLPLSHHPSSTDDADDNADAYVNGRLPLLQDEVILDSNDEEDEMNRYALGPVVEESLISVLTTLGRVVVVL